MRKISVDQFKKAVQNDPAWAAKLTEPTGVIGYCSMADYEITHLSPLLHFLNPGNSADFQQCPHLKVAEGHFAGWVSFFKSGVEKIGDLRIKKANSHGNAANFESCKNLKVAEGTFPGFVSFADSGVKTVRNLVTSPNHKGHHADFIGCDLFVPEKMLGAEYQMDDATRRKNVQRHAVAKNQAIELEI